MNILFSALHFATFRNFEPVVRALSARGHRVHLSADEPEALGGQDLAERLAAECAGVTWDFSPPLDREPWFDAAARLRVGLEYARFVEARYAGSPKLRRRYAARAPRVVRAAAAVPGVGAAAARAALVRIERSLPRSAAGEAYLRGHAPDVLLLASLTHSRSPQLDHLKNARALGIPVAACIASWDHLSSKALLHIAPDRVLVWNEVQRREAAELHGLPPDRVVVTGAQCYDDWFTRAATRSRDEFCRAVGLRPDRPFVLYVCSALTPTPEPPEPVFVRRWIEALRAGADPALREAGILVRPHPERVKEWARARLDGLDNVVVHGRNPIDTASRNDYFDSLHYSSAVVGLVTSVFLEAAIMGRPVLTLLLPEYRAHQDEMVHFRYLREVEGGILRTASTFEEHIAQLAAAIAEPGRDARNLRFLTAFVRPHGLDAPATPAFVEAVERLAAEGRRRPDPVFARRGIVARVVSGVALARMYGLGPWLLMDSRDVAIARAERQKTADRAARLEARTADKRRRMRAWRTHKLKNLIKRKLGWA